MWYRHNCGGKPKWTDQHNIENRDSTVFFYVGRVSLTHATWFIAITMHHDEFGPLVALPTALLHLPTVQHHSVSWMATFGLTNLRLQSRNSPLDIIIIKHASGGARVTIKRALYCHAGRELYEGCVTIWLYGWCFCVALHPTPGCDIS